jgi:DNA-binding MarR family transcriptional regulator
MQEIGLYPVVNEIYVYASLLMKHFNEALEVRLHQQGENLTGLQIGVLRMLQNEVLTLSIISQRMGMDPSSILRIIDALERKGFVARGVDPHDRRRNPIRITDKGIDLLITVPIISEQDPIYLAISAHSEERATQLRDLLHAIVTQFPDGRMVADLLSLVPGGQIPHSGSVPYVNKE